MPRVVFASTQVQQILHDPPLLQTSLPGGEPWVLIWRNESGYRVRFIDLVDFEISSSGKKISVHAVPGVRAGTIEHLYQNQALPLALSLQKKFVLHGSAVEIGNEAVAFIAESGRGKSTLAASFSSNGLRFLTDDGLQIDKRDDEFIIRPSHPSIRLWDDSCNAIAQGDPQSGPALDRRAKVRFLADENFSFCDDIRTLKHVYFLGDGSSEDVVIKPIGSQKAFIEMRRHCFLLGVDEHEMLASNFQQLADLSRLPIFFSLDYPRCYDALGLVRKAVINHVRQGLQFAESASI